MSQTKLRAVTVYLTPQEYDEITTDAVDHGVTVSAYIKARLGFKMTRRGAPPDNSNRRKRDKQKRPANQTVRD